MMLNQQKIFDQLLYVGALRGEDATGVIAIHKDGDFSIMKEACDSYGFAFSYKDSEVDKALYKKGVAIIGHNRAKTIGENKDENAHPFVEDKTFAMVHNGTLRNHKTMHDTEVDSHALTILFKQAMDADDWKPAMEDALGKVSGAFACVWYDQKRNQLCLIRNAERPLSMIVTTSAVVFTSEAAMGTWICGRNGEKVESVTSLDTMALYQFDMAEQGGEFSKTFLSPNIPIKQPHKGYTNGTTTATAVIDVTAKAVGQDNLDPGQCDTRIELSKNGFKKLRGTVLGRHIGFWVADYVDTLNNNSGECVNALIMGESLDGAYDLCEVKHCIRAQAELKPLGLKESDFYGNVRMRGRVYEMTYDKDKCQAIIMMDNLKVEEISSEVVH